MSLLRVGKGNLTFIVSLKPQSYSKTTCIEKEGRQRKDATRKKRLPPQLGGLLAHGGTTELRQMKWKRTIFPGNSGATGVKDNNCNSPTGRQKKKGSSFASALPLTTALIIGDLRRRIHRPGNEHQHGTHQHVFEHTRHRNANRETQETAHADQQQSKS